MTNILGIQFVPLNIPLKRRLQTFAVFLVFSEYFFFGVLTTMFMIWLLFSQFFMVSVFYFFWIIYDKSTINKGSRLKMWYRRLPIWRYCADYFPITLRKTTDLDPNENYIFACHPHGILAISSFLNFSTEATEFSKKFPGITPRMTTLNLNFWMPLHREYLMFNGMCSASKESIEWIISKNGKGNAAVIVIGGAAESLDAIPHKMYLTLKNRKGFVKLALQQGVYLVPIISFGENELYTQREHSESSLIKRIQRIFMHIFQFAIPLFNGRGVLQYTFGYLPHRKPINTIVGKPIKVPQMLNPSQEDINQYHHLYVESLCELFYANREQLSANANHEMVIK